MFLKKIELQGFKSFAERTVITFESPYTGIVGPNGCGKSNIADAIRWVLGEQSAKSLRGTTMTDVVFAGAEGKRGVNIAEVTLTFDNTSRTLNTDFDEVEVTRRLYKNTNESEYFINKTPCRLKDVVDLSLDTGLGRDSLSIISQGTIQEFADAKPVDRRGLFEEAAGVAKYKKRKGEALSKLQRTQDNIDRLQDIVNELEKQVSPLRRQARKAQKYQEKKARLTQIEVAVLVRDIQGYQKDLATLAQQIDEFNYSQASDQAAVTLLENEVDELKGTIDSLDSAIQSQQDALVATMTEIQDLEKRQVEIEEKRKYIARQGTDAARQQQLRQQLAEAKLEYEDRARRVDSLQADIDLAQQNLDRLTGRINETQTAYDQASGEVNYLQSRKAVLEAQAKAPYQNQAGVKAVMTARNVLPGIHDTVGHLFQPDDGYQLAVSTALGGAVYHIVTTDEAAARSAIGYLKNNHAGRATFLPLSVMKPHYVPKDHLFVAENTDGFLGLASDFVECDESYDGLVLSLLGNVLVCRDLECANELARRLKQQYNIVTLDGDVVHRGGSMTGGDNRRASASPLTVSGELAQVEKTLAEAQLKADQLLGGLNRDRRQRESDQEKLVAAKVQLASLQQVLDVKRSKYESLKTECDQFDDSDQDGAQQGDELVRRLNDAYRRKDEITNDIAAKRASRLQAAGDQQRKEIQLRQKRQQVQLAANRFNAAQVEQTRLTTLRDSQLDRLSREYQMTYEYASSLQFEGDLDEAAQEVLVLRQEIHDLGNVNLDAPKDYEEVNGRYEFMVGQLNDLTASREKLLEAINEMDEVMTRQFSETFDKINASLGEVFAVLFGGGRARLVLEDPDDILNTGIDIDVQPPGKNIQNIRLFSGGEKSLIAICVLFAILKARPMPLCILDEVEASLDQGNVERFARYIHEFSGQTQFIIITHRPGTMTECDVLYGITMPQKGVSKVIRVKLKEALAYAEEGTTVEQTA